jgi:propanol-preferring alcohol dehydrogenase
VRPRLVHGLSARRWLCRICARGCALLLRATGRARRCARRPAHIVAQLARWKGQLLYAFTRPGDSAAQTFAASLGAHWVGDSDRLPPAPLDGAIIFAPVGALVPLALQALRKGGTLVCGGIHMSDIPAMPYSLLWGERTIRSVANLTRRDGTEFLALAGQIPIRTEIETFPLADANDALNRLRAGQLTGAAVLIPG